MHGLLVGGVPPVGEGKQKPADPKQTKTPDKWTGVLGWAKSIAIAFVMWVFLRALVVEAFHITSGSMERTLLVGDVLFVNKALYGAEFPVIHTRLPAIREPRRQEIVIFESVEEPGLTVVKRIIGMPGDTIEMKNNVVFLNGIELAEPYVVRSPDTLDYSDPKMRQWQLPRLVDGVDVEHYQPTVRTWGPLVVPSDSFLVLGDNRDDSYDGRYWGFLGRDRIHGRAALIYYSHDRNGILPLPFITAIRWNRLFTLVR
jgi:signal peptidase I